MSFSPLRRLDYGKMANADDGNQIISNLDAIQARVEDHGSGYERRIVPVSFTAFGSDVFANHWSGGWTVPTANGDNYIKLLPTNYPDHDQFAVFCMGTWVVVTKADAADEGRADIALTFGNNVATPNNAITDLNGDHREHMLMYCYPGVTYRWPVTMMQVITHNPAAPAGGYYAWPQMRATKGVQSMSFTGKLFYIEK